MTTANITWVEDMQFVGQGETGHAIVMDASEGVGGHNTGATPMEVLLMGVLGCTAMDVMKHLEEETPAGQGVEDFRHRR